MWREPLGDASFYSPSEVLQEVHTDLIFLSTISLFTEQNVISFPERCHFSLLDQMPVLAQLINSSLLWKDKVLPYTNACTHIHMWFHEPEACSMASQADLFEAVIARLLPAVWSSRTPCEWVDRVQLEKLSPLCFAELLLTGSAPLWYCNTRVSGILQSGRGGTRAVMTCLAVEPFELTFFTGLCIVHRSLDFMSVFLGRNILYLSC